MRNTIIAAILLFVVIVFVIVNAFIVADITDKLILLTDETKLDALKEYWDDKSYYLSISTNLSVIEDADKALLEMISYHESECEEEYKAAAQRFLNSLDEIATGEKAYLYNIF